jgi:hypothetical protein
MNEELNLVVDEMLQVKDAIARYKFELKQLEQQEELLNIKLIGYLKKMNVEEMMLPNCHFGMRTKSRTAFDQKLFATENPDLFNQYRTTKETEYFEFKIGGC